MQWKRPWVDCITEYKVTWKNDDGSIIKTENVAYGKVPTCDNPTKDADDQYTYTFKGWDQTPVAVTGEATYTAQYTRQEKYKYYTINVVSDDSNFGTVSGGGTFKEGMEIKIVATPKAYMGYDSFFIEWTDGNTDNPRTITVTR